MTFRILRDGNGTYYLQYKRWGFWWYTKQGAGDWSVTAGYGSEQDAGKAARDITALWDSDSRRRRRSVVTTFNMGRP